MDRRVRLKIAFNPFEHRIGPLLRRAVRQLGHHNKISLVLFGEEALRQRLEETRRDCEEHPEQQQHRHRPRQERADHTRIAPLCSTERPVEEGPKPTTRFMLRQEDHRTERRAQRQRHKSGYGDRDRNRGGELLIERAGDPADKADRDKDRYQHQHDGDDRRRHFAHRPFGRVFGR